jgi:hypothetical protein
MILAIQPKRLSDGSLVYDLIIKGTFSAYDLPNAETAMSEIRQTLVECVVDDIPNVAELPTIAA